MEPAALSAVFLGARHSDFPISQISYGHAHDFFELNFLTSGRTKMCLNEQVIHYDSFDFVLIPPGITHILYESKYGKFDNFVIWFNALEGQFASGNIIKLHDYDGAVQFLCSEIYRLYTSFGMNYEDIINAYLHAILLHMKRGIVMDIAAPMTKTQSLIEQAVHYINKNLLLEPVSVSSIAKELNISPAYFSRIFHNATGVTPIQYIIDAKMAEARRLLIKSDLSIQEIAAALQCEDPLYFSRQFSSYNGISPREFRKSYTTEKNISKKSMF